MVSVSEDASHISKGCASGARASLRCLRSDVMIGDGRTAEQMVGIDCLLSNIECSIDKVA